MADIKIAEKSKKDIKVFDSKDFAKDKMLKAYIKSKEDVKNTEGEKDNEPSPSNYALDNISFRGRKLAEKTRVKLNKEGKKAVNETKENISNIKRIYADKIVSEKHINIGGEKVSINKLGPKDNMIINNRLSIREQRNIKKGNSLIKKRMQKQYVNKMQRQRLAKNIAIDNIRNGKLASVNKSKIASNASMVIKRILSAIRAFFMMLLAGGWLAVLTIIICCLFGAAFYYFGDDDNSTYYAVSSEVEAYTPMIKKYAKELEMIEYVELIKAVMMQESSGKGKDPMQASECPFNTKYPRKPGGIKNAKYSIECGIKHLKSVLKDADVKNPLDMDNIKLALQGYNYGNGYIPWALKKYGGYSKEGAIEFSNIQASKLGWDSYGDKDYVEHVLRYYPYGDYSYDIEDNGSGILGLPIKGMTRGHISSHFGPRQSPGGIGSTNHMGIDIAFPRGTKVLACEGGTVVNASYSGGFGKCIMIEHQNGLKTIYAHLDKIDVKKGQPVLRGQVIGKVGNTGNSTGPHLHLSVMKNGKYVNPEKGYLSFK